MNVTTRFAYNEKPGDHKEAPDNLLEKAENFNEVMSRASGIEKKDTYQVLGDVSQVKNKF